VQSLKVIPQGEEAVVDLAKIVVSMAVAMGVVVAASHAAGEDETQPPAPATKPTTQKKIEDRETQRRQEMAEQQKRKEAFSRRCNSNALKPPHEAEFCREAYRKL
jgi:pyruvate-formate lyase-activating enzyme